MPLLLNNRIFSSLQNVDRELKIILDAKSEDKEYWTFKGSTRKHAHVYSHYPAMMVPDLQGELIDILLSLQPGIRRVLDPFVGSGTTMTECMFRGLDFVGQDINPLAVLISKAKIGPFNRDVLSCRFREIHATANKDQNETIEIYFSGLTKWFRSDVAVDLSKIFRAIKSEELLWVRRFFWVAFSEVVRLSSNSRTSTYKLHIRPNKEIYSRIIKPLQLFESVVTRNIEQLNQQELGLRDLDLIDRFEYKFNADIHFGNSSKSIILPADNLLYDLVVTSPPYGDNKTTVPYGQNAFLPLQWIVLADIDRRIDSACLKSTAEIDTHSLGGYLKNAQENVHCLLELSPALEQTMQLLEDSNRVNKAKVAAFFYDFNNTIQNICKALNKNAYLVWTIGNRRVSDKEIPTDLITIELMKNQGAKFVLGITRDIYSKKMPSRNSISQTMKDEKILIFRKE